MIEYLSSGRKYLLSYQQLREDHYRFVRMTDEEFMRSIPDALHFACVVCWLKEVGNECLSDTGIVHQLVHLMTIPPDALAQLENLHEIRDQFKLVLNLA